ncbi:MAG: homoserine dehydrogenase [Firmicutes bacterium]|nr:homoserine dehydrogenase [Bacillota bacterium]
MDHIALLGLGTVGGGVAEILMKNRSDITAKTGLDIDIKHILDLRKFPDHPLGDRVTDDYNLILGDPEVTLVAEMMGGVHPAYEFTAEALRAKKSVVTSNKAVVAEYGVELLELAAENGVRYLFEASVGGGIPIIHSMTDSMYASDIYEIDGILNGTTNYILSAMKETGVSFDAALKDAQKLGYAEANPTEDVDGFDACRKICILAAMASGRLVYFRDVPTKGIREITTDDIKAASAKGGAIKLIAKALFKENGEIELSVAPEVVYPDNPLFNVNGVYNGVLVRGRNSGDLLFYGSGAGKLPTAGAVISDIIDILLHKNEMPAQKLWHK